MGRDGGHVLREEHTSAACPGSGSGATLAWTGLASEGRTATNALKVSSMFEVQLLQSCPAIGLATAVWGDPGSVITPDNILLP